MPESNGMEMIQSTPDYTLIEKIPDLENALPGFKWQGCGLYCTETDTLLITPNDVIERDKFWEYNEPHKYYTVQVFNCNCKNTIFDLIGSSIPRRQ